MVCEVNFRDHNGNRMNNGTWSVKMTLRIGGRTKSGGEKDSEKTVFIPLKARDETDAQGQAWRIAEKVEAAAQAKDRDYFRQYCTGIGEKDRIACIEFGIAFEKKMDAGICVMPAEH